MAKTKAKSRPKKSAAGLAPGLAQTDPGVSTQTTEETIHGVDRHNRVPLGGAIQTLTISTQLKEQLEDENKHIHYILDDDRGRLQQAKNAGYEHVVDKQGHNIFRTAGGRMQYLMCIPKLWREDDLKRKRAAARVGVEATTLGDNEYSPTGGKSATTSTTSSIPY